MSLFPAADSAVVVFSFHYIAHIVQIKKINKLHRNVLKKVCCLVQMDCPLI